MTAATASPVGDDDAGVAIARQRYSEGKKAERKLGFLLALPAMILMIAVPLVLVVAMPLSCVMKSRPF